MNILVTAIGSMSAETVIDALRSAGHHVVGCDVHPASWLPTARLVDAFHQTPYASDSTSFLAVLEAICRSENVDFILPLTDPEVDVIVGWRAPPPRHRARVALSSPEAISTCRDKWLVFQALADQAAAKGIPTQLVAGLRKASVGLPALAKPRRGRSSEGVLRLSSPIDVDYLLESPAFRDHVVQPFLSGDLYTVDVVRHPSTGRVVAVPRKELIRSVNGAGLSVEVLDDAVLIRLASLVAEHFGVIGCVNIEFIRHQDTYYVLDINPRFSAGLAFTQMSGYDMVTNHLRCFGDDDIDPCRSISSVLIGKRYHEIRLAEVE
jgi:carbamoyl-phosphate synthase large subunit